MSWGERQVLVPPLLPCTTDSETRFDRVWPCFPRSCRRAHSGRQAISVIQKVRRVTTRQLRLHALNHRLSGGGADHETATADPVRARMHYVAGLLLASIVHHQQSRPLTATADHATSHFHRCCGVAKLREAQLELFDSSYRYPD